MSAASPELVWDGVGAQPQGVNDGLSRFRLAPTQAALLINATTRGDYVTQRPGWDRIMSILPAGIGFFQHAGSLRTDSGRVFILVVVGGRIFRVDPAGFTVLEITIPGDRNPSTLTRGWSVQAEQFWLYNDGQTKTFIWNGGSARRAGKGEIQPGTVLAYVQGRVWYALPNGRAFRAGDLVGNRDSGTEAFNFRDSVLKETENTYLNEGGDFQIPPDSGEISAMKATAILDTSQGQGPLLVIGSQNGFSVNTPVDRTTWKNVSYPIQTETLIGAGAWSQQGTINVGNDLFFRAQLNGDNDGIRSYMVAHRNFRDWGNTPQSFEVSNVLAADQNNLLVYGSGAVYDNRFFETVSPNWTSAGVVHRGIVAMDLAPLSSILTQSPPVYDGLWTGLNILSLVPTTLGLYAIVLAGNGNIELWRLTKKGLYDNGGRITWSHVPAALFRDLTPTGAPKKTLKRLEAAKYDVANLRGQVDITVSWAPDAYPCYTEWHSWTECYTTCSEKPSCPPGLNFQPGDAPNRQLPEPPNAYAQDDRRPLRNFYTLNVKTDITGPCQLLGFLVGASLQAEPKYRVNTCPPAQCQAIRCCGNAVGSTAYLFDYTAHGTSGSYYAGYDYGFQQYYGEGFAKPPPAADTGGPTQPTPPPTPPQPVPPGTVPPIPDGPFNIPVVNGWQGEIGFTTAFASFYGIPKITNDIAADGMTAAKATFAVALLKNEILQANASFPVDQVVFAWDWVDPYLSNYGLFNDKYATGDPVPHEGDPIGSLGVALWRLTGFYKQT